MECQFDGTFTKEEKRRIRASLEDLSGTVRMIGVDGEVKWHVKRIKRNSGAIELRAVHVRSEITFWGHSVDDLIDMVNKTKAFLRRAG